MVTLETVEIPGYADAVRHEARVRDTAFLDGPQSVCGVWVRPLSLRRLIWLEQAQNGLVVPWRFDSEDELLTHSLQLVWFCRPEYAPPTDAKYSFYHSFKEGLSQHRFFRSVLTQSSPAKIIKEVEEWTSGAFMDSPAGGGGVRGPSYAAYPAYIVDKFAEAGLPFSYEQIMDMPLPRLWQHWRLAVRRVNGVSLTNPSDDLRVAAVAGGAK